MVPSNPVRNSPRPLSVMTVAILLGCAVREKIVPLMFCPGRSMVPFISIDFRLLHASRPPMAATDFSTISFASGSVALAAGAGVGADSCACSDGALARIAATAMQSG